MCKTSCAFDNFPFVIRGFPQVHENFVVKQTVQTVYLNIFHLRKSNFQFFRVWRTQQLFENQEIQEWFHFQMLWMQKAFWIDYYEHEYQ